MAAKPQSIKGTECKSSGCEPQDIENSASAGSLRRDAAKTAGSSDGPWHLANTPALKIALSNAFFTSLGLSELTAHG